VVTQAADEFQKSYKSLKSTAGGESRTTLASSAQKQKTAATEDVLTIMERTNLSFKKPTF
jgi:hypothetical protein